MKTVLAIDTAASWTTSLSQHLKGYKKKITLLHSAGAQQAEELIAQNPLDLLLCRIDSPEQQQAITALLVTYPYLPCLAIGQRPSAEQDGASGILRWLDPELPVENLTLQIHEHLENEHQGLVRDIPLHSLLQMIETEGLSCTLAVENDSNTGFLYLLSGNLVDAQTSEAKGETAAIAILSWPDSSCRMRYFNQTRPLTIKSSLLDLIMEAFKLRVANDGNGQSKVYSQQHQLPLNHLSTQEKRLELDLGEEISLEIPGKSTVCEAKLAGMVVDSCIIVSCPEKLTVLEKIGKSQRIILKFITGGRMWMFKSRLQQIVFAPSQLMIFDYPGVVHYHELRKAKRTAIFIPAIVTGGQVKLAYASLLDLSVTGTLCKLDHPKQTAPAIDLNCEIEIRCLLPGIREEQRIYGQVKNLRQNHDKTLIGVEFDSLQPHLRDTIENYLYSLEFQQDSPARNRR